MGKASLPKSGINDTLDANRERKKQFGRERAAFAGVQGVSSTIGGGFNTTGNNTTQSTSLSTAGGAMVGPIAFHRGTKLYYPTSANNNTLDISQTTGLNSSHWIWPAGGSSTLEIISGASFTGQILFVEITQTQTETIKDRSNTSGGNTGNIKTLDGNDLVLGTDKTIVLFMYTDVDGYWHQVSNPIVGSGANTALSNLTSPTSVNQSLVMNDNNITGLNAINFTDAGAQIANQSTVPHLNFVLTGDSTFRFTTNAENILDITDDGLTMLGTNNIILGNNNITGVNQIAFNETNQTITDNTGGMRFSLPDSTDTYDFTIDSNTTLSIEKFFFNLSNTRIQMNDEVDPSSPVSGDIYVYAKQDGGISKLFYKQSDGTVVGPLAAASGSSGANTSLSNLGSTAINAALIPASNLGVHLGSSAKKFNAAYIYQIPSLHLLTMDGTVGANINMEGGILHFDDDNDTYIESSNDDQMQFFSGGSVRMKVNNSNVLFTTDISMTSGTRIDFANNTGTPTGAGGYVKVKIGGVEKFIPYYS